MRPFIAKSKQLLCAIPAFLFVVINNKCERSANLNQQLSRKRSSIKMALCILLACICINIHAQSNYALSFDGANDYVNIVDNNALDLSADFTLESWIYPTGTGSQPTEGGMILNKENSYEIARFADGTIRFALSANGVGNDWTWTNTGLVAPLNQWSHIAMVKNGTSVTVYLNGISSGIITSQPATLTANTQALRIAGRTISSHYFIGYVDEVRIWNKVRTQTEVKTNLFNKNLSNTTAGLVAYYRLNEGLGTTTINSASNTTGIDGTLTNGPLWAASPIQHGLNALHFDGTNYIEMTNRINLGTSDFTLEAWVYPTNTSTGMVFAQDVCSDGEHQFRLYTNNSKINFDLSGAAALGAPYSFQLPSTANSVPLSTWTHVAAVRSGNTYTVYINGVSNATISTGANTINNLSGADANKRLRIGARGGVSMGCGVNFYKGNIDEIRFWNVARSGTEIQQNYNVEINAASNSNLGAYYTMNQGIANGTNTGLTTLIDQKGTNNGTLTNFSLTGSTANYVSQYSSLIVLPLKWLSFTAQRKNETVLLQWSTASEINTNDFAVEHSANGSDWQSISTLPATGNSNHIQKYSYTDAAPIAGMNWYRIKQRDNDGKYSYSKIRTVRVNKNQLLNVLGNPVTNGVLHIQINQSTPQLVSLFSSDGKLLWTRQLVPGKHSINVAQMPRGTYLLRYGSYSEALLFE